MYTINNAEIQEVDHLLDAYKIYCTGDLFLTSKITDEIQKIFSPLIASIIKEDIMPYIQTNNLEFDELYNEAACLLYANISRYNKELSSPVTFFYKVIKNGLYSYVNDSLSICSKET